MEENCKYMAIQSLPNLCACKKSTVKYIYPFQEYEEPDVTMTTLKFPSGAVVVIELHYVSSVKFDMRLEVSSRVE